MAQFLIQHGHQPVHGRAVLGHARHVGGHAPGFRRIKKGNLRPGRQIDIDGVRHRQQARPHLAPQASAVTQRRHGAGQGHQPVEVGAAQPDAVAGKDIDRRPRAAKDREIRGAATDIDDQPDLARAAHSVAGQRRRLGFGQKGDLGEACRQIAAAQIRLGLRIAFGVVAVEMHRAPRQRAAEGQARGGLGPLAQFGKERGDDFGQRPPPAGDQPRFMEKSGPQHAFQRPHIAALGAIDQRVGCGLTDAHGTAAGREKDGGRQRLGARLDGKAADAAVLHDGGGRVRRSKIDGKRVVAHPRPRQKWRS